MRFLTLLGWLAVAALMIFLVTQPVSLNTHFVTSMIVIVVMAIMKLFDRTGALRAVVLALGTAVVLRYVYWRTFTTIPPIDEPLNFVPGVLLYVAEMYSVVMLFLQLLRGCRPYRQAGKSSPRRQRRARRGQMFVPTLNEERALFSRTTLPRPKRQDGLSAEKLNVLPCSTTAARAALRRARTRGSPIRGQERSARSIQSFRPRSQRHTVTP